MKFREFAEKADIVQTVLPHGNTAISSLIADDEIEVTYDTDAFLSELGDLYPAANVEGGHGPGNVRVSFEEQRPESFNGYMSRLGFENLEGMFRRGALFVTVEPSNKASSVVFLSITDNDA